MDTDLITKPIHTNEVCKAQQNIWMGDNGLMVHQYRRCGFSGSGNCCCGRQKESPLHPHVFVLALTAKQNGRWFCVCSKLADHSIHQT